MYNLNSFVGGIGLTALRKEDGLLHSYLDRATPIAEWPATFSFDGRDYCLESVRVMDNGHEEANYL